MQQHIPRKIGGMCPHSPIGFSASLLQNEVGSERFKRLMIVLYLVQNT